MHKKILLTLICLAQFIIIVDFAIVNVALPTMSQELGLSQSGLQWVVIAYGLLFGGFLLVGGRLGDVMGRRKVLLSGLVLFTTASLAAGLANSAALLIVSRGIQGLGAALIAPSVLSILAATFQEGKERNAALGLLGAVGGVAGTLGVFASGLITDGPGWRWIFFINVPIGIVLLGVALKYLHPDAASKDRNINLLGAVTITGGLMAFVYALNKGAETGWISSATLAAFVLAAVLFIAFWRVESVSSNPLVPLSAFKNRVSTAALLIGLFNFGAQFSFIFMMTLFMQQQLHFSPTQTGIAWLVTPVTAFIVSALTGAKLVNKISLRGLFVIDLSLIIIGALWLARSPLDASYFRDVFPAMFLMGIAFGITGPVVQIGALTGVKLRQIGLISGVAETTRELGAVIAIAAVTTILVVKGADLEGFHGGFLAMALISLLGLVTTIVAFRPLKSKRLTSAVETERGIKSSGTNE